MLRKTNSQKGFTIIEVVITIAIGAAVMALVLNAVAGARRSQRNNARAADVNAIAAGVNQYIATRNELPDTWAKISAIVDPTKFGHYEVSSINPVSAAASKKGPTNGTAGNFVAWTTSALALDATALTEDEVVVIRQAGCSGTSAYADGGIREMAIVYKLEGQTNINCLEI